MPLLICTCTQVITISFQLYLEHKKQFFILEKLLFICIITDPPIIHRDIKSANIFITENFHAKVADFGFARLAAEEDPGATHISTQVKGTAGYLDPEYLKTYQLTEKSDVYSFGVLLVEIITGRSPIERTFSSDEKLTTKWVSVEWHNK